MVRRHKLLMAGLLGLAVCYPSIAHAKDDDFNAKHRTALNFNEAMNRCLASGCKNLEEVMGFFAEDAVYLDEAGHSWSGVAAIRKQLARTTAAPGTSDRIEGLDVSGLMITLRLERRRVLPGDKWAVTQVNPHVQVIVLKSGRIARLISVIPPDEK